MKTDHLYRALRMAIVFFMGALVMACGKNNPDNPTPEPNNGDEHKVVVLDKNERPTVKNLTADGTVVFDGTEMAEKLTPGTIICSEPTENAPYGFLYKVKSVTTEKGNTVVQTEFAAFEEAVENGSASETFDLLSHVKSIKDWNGNQVELPETRVDVNSSLKLPLELHLPKPKNAGNITADFYLKGLLDLKVAFHLDVDIKKFKWQLFELWAEPECEFALTVGSNIKGKVEFERFRLYEMELEPITIPIAGVPLVIVPKVCIDIKPSAEGTISLDAKLVDLDFRYKGGIRYTKRTGWEVIDENTSKDPVLFNELAKLEMEGKLTVPPYISVIPAFYGLSSEDAEAGIDSGIPFTLKISDFDLEDIVEGYLNPQMKFTWGIEAGVHAKLKILGYELLDFNPKATLAEWVIVDKHLFPKFSTMTVDEFEPGKARLTFRMEDLDDCFFTTNSDYGVYWTLGEWIRNVENENAEKVSLGYLDLSTIPQGYNHSPGESLPSRYYEFDVVIDGIRPNTLYTVRPFVDNLLHVRRGDANVFISSNQMNNPLTVITLPVEQYVSTAATLRGQFETDGSISILEKGFCISDTETIPSLDNARKVVLELNEDQCDVYDLKPSTKYYVRAYAKSARGVVYGSIVNFTTTHAVSTLIDVTPTELIFGKVSIGSSASRTVTVTNIGTGVLTFYLAGAGSGFTFSPSSEVTLESGKSCEVTITFAPSSTGQVGSTLRVFSNATNGTKYIECRGEGVDSSDIVTETITVNGVSFNMVKVEGGSFMMGMPDDDPDIYWAVRPRHEVVLSDFYIGQTEVTEELFEAVLKDAISVYGEQLPAQVAGEWMMVFIARLNALTGLTFRLPTEAEWEYAARGGRFSMGFRYAGSNDIDEVAWYANNSFEGASYNHKAHPVGQKKPNELGLYDMSGNVAELCQDRYYYDYNAITASVNPCYWRDPTWTAYYLDHRIKRGGDFGNGPRYLNVYHRENEWTGGNAYANGFRLVLSDINHLPGNLCPDNNHPHLIDLGLPSGTKWSCCNVGSTMPEGSGDYYAWGETEIKEDYSSETYRFYSKDDRSYDDLGSIVGTSLDVAHVKWGDKWQMPSKEQIEELFEYCVHDSFCHNGVIGKVFIGPNNNLLFLPFTGFKEGNKLHGFDYWDWVGYYWSGVQETEDHVYNYLKNQQAFTLYIYADGDTIGENRAYGCVVRPVYDE